MTKSSSNLHWESVAGQAPSLLFWPFFLLHLCAYLLSSKKIFAWVVLQLFSTIYWNQQQNSEFSDYLRSGIWICWENSLCKLFDSLYQIFEEINVPNHHYLLADIVWLAYYRSLCSVLLISIIIFFISTWKSVFFIYFFGFALLSVCSFFVLYEDPMFYFQLKEYEKCKEVLRSIARENGENW